MAQAVFTIAGRTYRMACDEGEEAHIEGLAQMVDSKIGDLRSSFGEIGDQRLVVMAALTIADELSAAQKALAAQKTLAAEAAAEAEDLRRRQDEWSEKLAVEIEDLAEKIEAAARTVGQG